MESIAIDPVFEQYLRSRFNKPGLLQYLGAQLEAIQAGRVSISLPYSDRLTQQYDYFHAGAITSIVDTACGYAALTLMPPGSGVLTVEFKVNFITPAQGESILARAEVLRAGRTISVCRGDVFSISQGQENLCATMLATMIRKPLSGNAKSEANDE